MTSGKVVALCLARQEGIDHWLSVVGPTGVREAMREAPNSLRARYGNPDHEIYNALHASDSPESSEREIELIFPHILEGASSNGAAAETLEESVIDSQPEANKDYLQKYVCPTLLRGLSEMYERRPESPVGWLAQWLTENNPYKKPPRGDRHLAMA